MRITAGFTGAIASAVAGEVNRLQQHPELCISEGGAYKAAWSRLGSDPQGHCEAARRDCLVSSLIVTLPRAAALNLARGQAGLGVRA